MMHSTTPAFATLLLLALPSCGSEEAAKPKSATSITVKVDASGRVSLQGTALPAVVTNQSIEKVLGPHSRVKTGTDHEDQALTFRVWDRLGVWTVAGGDTVRILNLQMKFAPPTSVETSHTFEGKLETPRGDVLLSGHVDVRDMGFEKPDWDSAGIFLDQTFGDTKVRIGGQELSRGRAASSSLFLKHD